MLSFFSQSRPSKSALSPAAVPPSRFLARGMHAFTLVELLVVVAIIGILGIIALPMYSNYATKSKFTEVELATAPIKTFVSTCAVSGDCVSAGAISLGSAAAVGTPATAPPTLNAAQLAIGSPRAWHGSFSPERKNAQARPSLMARALFAGGVPSERAARRMAALRDL